MLVNEAFLVRKIEENSRAFTSITLMSIPEYDYLSVLGP